MSWKAAAHGFARLHSRSGLSHNAYQTINEALVITGLVSGTLSLALYTYTSLRITRQFGFQNIFTILAWFMAVCLQCLSLYGFSHGGIGRHQATLSASEILRFTDVILAFVVIFIPMVCIAKLSLITLYYRLNPLGRLWRACMWIITLILVVPTVVLVLLYIFGCRPLAMAWNSNITEGQCIDRLTIMLTSSVFNVVTDLLMIIAPVPLIWNLQMKGTQKLGVLLMFFLGCVTIITSICRAITVDQLFNEEDHPYHMAVPILWANAETVLVVICDCLPSLRPFFRHHFPTSTVTGSGDLTRTPGSEIRTTREQRSKNYFDDDIELIHRGGKAPDPMVISRTMELDLQYHRNETTVSVNSGTSGHPVGV